MYFQQPDSTYGVSCGIWELVQWKEELQRRKGAIRPFFTCLTWIPGNVCPSFALRADRHAPGCRAPSVSLCMVLPLPSSAWLLDTSSDITLRAETLLTSPAGLRAPPALASSLPPHLPPPLKLYSAPSPRRVNSRDHDRCHGSQPSTQKCSVSISWHIDIPVTGALLLLT